MEQVKDGSRFKELARLPITDSTTIILSEVYREQEHRGYSVTKYVDSPNFTGYSRGIFIPKDMLGDFLRMFPREEAE